MCIIYSQKLVGMLIHALIQLSNHMAMQFNVIQSCRYRTNHLFTPDISGNFVAGHSTVVGRKSAGLSVVEIADIFSSKTKKHPYRNASLMRTLRGKWGSGWIVLTGSKSNNHFKAVVTRKVCQNAQNIKP